MITKHRLDELTVSVKVLLFHSVILSKGEVRAMCFHSGADLASFQGGGLTQRRTKNGKIFGALCAENWNITFCARSAPKI